MTRRGPARSRTWRAFLVWLAVMIFVSVVPASTVAAASRQTGTTELRVAYAPDWMSAETTAYLDLPYDVLVPPYIPGPFASGPEVSVSGGYYSLYWMIPGGAPTFLQITGELGGQIPDYSKYDRNVQLVENASVNGVPAYHDLTPIYDLVYWQVGDVVYAVESLGLSADDSLSLASALTLLVSDDGGAAEDNAASPGASVVVPEVVEPGATVSVDVGGVDGATLSTDYGVFPASGASEFAGVGGFAVEWQAPAPDQDVVVSFVLRSSSGETLAIANTFVPATFQQTELALDCPASAGVGERVEIFLSGAGYAVVSANAGSFPAESPNTDYASEADGGTTLEGALPDEGGSATLVWIAPDVAETQVVYLFAADENGNTPGECGIEVVASGDAEAAPVESPEQSAEATEEPAVEQADEPRPTSTRRPDEPADSYSEVRGLPLGGTEVASPPDAEGAASPTAAPTRTPSARPTATFAPTISDDGMVSSVIGPEGSTLESPSGMTVRIPADSVAGPSTLTIQPVAMIKLPESAAVEFVADTGYEVTIAGENGRAITKLGKRATIRIPVDQAAIDAGAKLYKVDGLQVTAVDDSKINGDMVEARVDAFGRYVVGIPQAAPAASSRRLLPFILAAVVVLVALTAMVILGGIFRPRRQRVVINSRRPARTARRR